MSQQNYPSAASHAPVGAPVPVKTTGMGIAGLVLGIIALLISWVPILNNFALILALLGLIFAIVGLVGCSRGKKRGKGIAIAGLVLAIISGVIVLVTQSMYSAALDAALDTSGVDQTAWLSSESFDTSTESSATASSDTTEPLEVGSSFTSDDGVIVTVESVSTGYTDFAGDPLTKVVVTYTNNSKKEASFSTIDWKSQDAQGAQEYVSWEDPDKDSIGSGSLAVGGTKTGAVYLEGNPTMILYSDNAYIFGTSAVWNLA